MTFPTEESLHALVDRQQIEELMSRYAHGVDRHDEDLIAAAYHHDAFDRHGPFAGGVAEFVKWVNPLHEGKTRAHTHNITTHWSELSGNSAYCDTYVLFALFLKDREVLMFGSGRYIDRLEKRGGEWRIAERSTVTEARLEGDATCFRNAPGGYAAGTWDRDDLSYLRPLAHEGHIVAPVERAIQSLSNGRDAWQELVDRRAVRDCVTQSLRGLDRADRRMLSDSFAKDASIIEGQERLPAEIWHGRRLDQFEQSAATTHNLTTHLAVVAGSEAQAESYVIVVERPQRGSTVWVGGFRLLDRLERGEGRWQIASRVLIADWEFEGDGAVFAEDDHYLRGHRHLRDPWYKLAGGAR